MSFTNTVPSQIQSRSIVIARVNGRIQRVPVTSRLWEPLAYPLFFPSGSLGWGVTPPLPHHSPHMSPALPSQLLYYRTRVLCDARFQIFGHLTSEYLVDMFTCDLECRLNYIRQNQTRIRQGECNATGDSPTIGTVYLPSSFLGSRRWTSEQIADGLALGATFGPPSFFVTMTCNPHWPEIVSQLQPSQQYHDVPLVVCRVFKQKLAHFLKTLSTIFPNAGRRQYIVHSIEFQKRGLPHCHILIKFEADCLSPDYIDQIVSVEMPSNDHDAAPVRSHMLHSHPAPYNPPSQYCQRETNGV